MLRSKSLSIIAGAAAVALIGLAAPQAQAFTITSCEMSTPPTNPCGTPPLNLGTVTATQVAGSTTQVEINATLATGNVFASTGALNNEALEFFTSTSGVTLVSATSSAASYSFALDAITGGYSITCRTASPTPCGGGTSPPTFSSLDFTVGVSSGTFSPSNLTTNANNELFLLDIGVPCGGASPQPACSPGSTAFNTGRVDVVPAPVIGHGLLVLLAVGGVLFSGKILESLKKRNLQAA